MKKLLFLFSCSDDALTYEEQLAKDIEKIEKYLKENNLVAQSTKSGLHYIIEVEGNGVYPTSTSNIKVNYTGKLLNGVVFDSQTSFFFYLNGVIKGWQEGIPKFSIGGKGKLFVPSGLGYGVYPSGDIPANSVLIFDIEIVNLF